MLYLSQRVDGAGNADMKDLTERLVERALAREGTFYLPYQLHYTRAQVREAYPILDEFFALKREQDPEQVFRNSLYERFAQDGSPAAIARGADQVLHLAPGLGRPAPRDIAPNRPLAATDGMW